MPFEPARRLWTVVAMVLSLLFSQLALANYVCPVQTDVTSAEMAEMISAGTPCDAMDPAQPVLCHQHSTDTAQTFEAVKLPAASLPLLLQVIVLELVPQQFLVIAVPITAVARTHPPPDPIFLATRRLRV